MIIIKLMPIIKLILKKMLIDRRALYEMYINVDTKRIFSEIYNY